VSGETLILVPAFPQRSRAAHGNLDIVALAEQARDLDRHHQHPPNTANMPGVSVRDVQADKFINAYAAFLKRQGKLPIPGS
jgi:hypothetical protein